ncbi:MAG: hypothetical protein GC157_02190 [Frankiales bacterium]|nr:hypothetical protein [Frankiales bacterium]
MSTAETTPSTNGADQDLLQVRINARLGGPQRGDRYEDPLAYWLEQRAPGSRVTGGGTLRSPEGEPLGCGIDARVVGATDDLLDALVVYLEEIGAPRGSVVSLGGQTRPLGRAEGLAIYLDGTGLPDEVYAAHDVNEFFDRLHEAVAGVGRLQSFWEGPTTTAGYVYGPSYDAMRAAVEPLVTAHPLAQGCRVEQIA